MRHILIPAVAAATLAVGATFAPAAHAEHSTHAAAPSPSTPVVAATKMALRDLWVEHVFWIRSYVVAVEAGDKGAIKASEAEVVANARQIAGAIEPFYGKAASDQLFGLLAGHWGAVKDIADTTKAGNQGKRQAATTALIDNAKAIAKFLSGANPHLPYDTLFALLSAHGAHHIAQIDQLHADKYQDEAKTWAAMRGHMLVIADALTDGLAAQFPAKF